MEYGAISRAQYDKSLGDLTLKMGIDQMDSQSLTHSEACAVGMLQPEWLQRTVEPVKCRMSTLKPFGNMRKYRETGGRNRKKRELAANSGRKRK